MNRNAVKLRLLLLSLSLSVVSMSSLSADDWGPEEGAMNWNDAVQRCQSKGMRLPTREELLAVYRSGEGKNWKYHEYWTGEEASSERAFSVFVKGGIAFGVLKSGGGVSVRCR